MIWNKFTIQKLLKIYWSRDLNPGPCKWSTQVDLQLHGSHLASQSSAQKPRATNVWNFGRKETKIKNLLKTKNLSEKIPEGASCSGLRVYEPNLAPAHDIWNCSQGNNPICSFSRKYSLIRIFGSKIFSNTFFF